MDAYPPTLRDLIRRLSRLPGLGEKSATRIAMHLLRAPGEDVEALAAALRDLKERIRTCPRCHHFTDGDLCAICADPARQTGELAVVEGTAELLALEHSGAFRGRYHVLQGLLSPLDGVGPDDIRLRELVSRIETEGVREVILALSPTAEGEATAHYITRLLAETPVRVTRIAYGIPMGGDVKYADQVTLQRAIEGRRPL